MALSNNVANQTNPLIELRDVSKCFRLRQEDQRSFQELFIGLVKRQHRQRERLFWPLRGVSFSVYQGESLGIVGPNGSGKSTLLKLVSGILEPTGGEIEVNGRLSALLELGAGFHPDLTGRENIFLNGSMYGLSRKEIRQIEDEIIEFSELEDFIDMPIKHYSSGMYVRLGFSVAIHTRPDVLLVDEVLSVGDATFQHKCMDAIDKFRRQGGTLLFISHDMGSIQSICDRAIWFEEGKIQAEGHPTEVAMQYLNHVAKREEAKHARKNEENILVDLQSGQRWGTGRLQITNVQLCDERGAPCSVFLTGAPMQIRIDYNAATRVDDPVFGIAIYHQNGTHICGPNTDFGEFSIPFVEEPGHIIYDIPSLALLEGGFLVSVAAHNRRDTEMFDFHDRVYSFRVYTGESRERYGLVTMNGTWRDSFESQQAL